MGKNMSQTNVVFGAAGSLGAAIVRRLAALGVPTRSVVRSLDRLLVDNSSKWHSMQRALNQTLGC
jgi:uncharacterized protein YbjT (DUF2867 family)